jgi:hypothetical protein
MKILWNKSVEVNCFSHHLKRDNIIYIWKKKGSRGDPAKYRPITLVTTISKITEALLNSRLLYIVPNPAHNFQHAYTKNRSTHTAILSLEESMFNNNKNYSAIIFVDLKGAFETVSHFAMEHLISKFNKNLSNLITSYLSDRKAAISNSTYPNDSPSLNYLPGRSTPQGSKISPTIFSYNSGLITKWFLDAYLRSSNDNIFVDVIVYADDAAIYVSCSTLELLQNKIPPIINLYSKIANFYGAALEPTKTEILINKSLTTSFPHSTIENCKISTETTIKWLGYNISINKNNSIKITIPIDKIYTIKNGVRLYQLYNTEINDNRQFYLTYIKPIFDLWLLDTDLQPQLKIYESQVLKLIGGITCTASTEDTYTQLAIPTIKQRCYKFAKNLEERNILTQIETHNEVLKSGKIRVLGPLKTLNQKLKNICVQNSSITEQPKFNTISFCRWRKMVRKVASNKAKYNHKK